jgi:hypothetical protein
MQHEIVSIVASRRGIAPLRDLLSRMPRSFHAPVVCLVESSGSLLEPLQAATRLDVRWAEPGAALEAGKVYVSRPGSSLICLPTRELAISPVGPEASAFNPVDNFLTSVASCYGERAVAVVLAGFDLDGTGGAAALRGRGGKVLVLDRATARYWGDAEPLVRAGSVDRVLDLAELAEALRVCVRGLDLLRCAEIQIALSPVLEHLLRELRTPMGKIQALRKANGTLRIVVQRGLPLGILEHFAHSCPGDGSASGQALQAGARVVIADVLAEPSYSPHRDAALQAGFRAVQSTPIRVDKKGIVGAICTQFAAAHAISEQEAASVDAAAQRAGALLEELVR